MAYSLSHTVLPAVPSSPYKIWWMKGRQSGPAVKPCVEGGSTCHWTHTSLFSIHYIGYRKFALSLFRYCTSIWLLAIPVLVRWREKQVKCPTSGNFYCPRDTVPLNSYRIEEEGLPTWHCPFKHLPNRGGGSAAAHRAILKQEGISRWGGGGEGGEGGLEAWLVVAGSNPKPLETVH